MQLKILICIILSLLILTPNVLALELSPPSEDINVTNRKIETNNETIYFLYHNIYGDLILYEEKEFYNGTVFYKANTTSYINTSIMRHASHGDYSLRDYNQTILVTYPDNYSFTLYHNVDNYYFNTYGDYTYIFIKTYYNFPLDSIINQTGNYYLNITTRIFTTSLTYEYTYHNITLNVISILGSYIPIELPNDDELLTFTYDGSFIGTFSGFICLFGLVVTPMFIAYKIKNTGEKLKWLVYGFLTICIVFFCMIAFFQMG